VLVGGKGADLLFGDAGLDTASYAGAAEGVVANLTTGGGAAGDALGDVYNLIENLTGSSFDDTLTGNDSSNVLRGGAGDDTLRGLAGEDKLVGGLDDDLLFGGAGADWLEGGFGIDTASYAGAMAGVIANLGNASANTRDALGDTYVSVENLIGTAHNDRLTGDNRENVISAGDGNDVVNGGDGADRLRGNAGADSFVFDTALNPLSNVDHILDYSVADDRIWLDDAVFTTLAAGRPLAGNAFHVGTAAATADHHIIYNAVSGTLSYDADGAGGLDAIVFARIGAGQALTALEFLVV
jgi:serralysin